MADTEQPPVTPVTAIYHSKKLVVIEFLNTHLEELGVSNEGHNLLYRMVELISALGKEIHSIAQSPQHIVLSSVIREMKLHAMCVLEGCKVCKRDFEKNLRAAQTAAAHLPDLEGDWEVEGEVLKGKMMVWRDELRNLHIPTGNEGRLIRHMANHYFDEVFSKFFAFHRQYPANTVWDLNEHFTDIQEALENIHHICITADAIVEELEKDELGARKKLQQWLEDRKEPAATGSAPESQVVSVVSTPRTARRIPSTPSYTGDKPPQLPPLPFQIPGGDMEDPFAIPAAFHVEDTSSPLHITQSFATHPRLHVEDTTSPLLITQSFAIPPASHVEDTSSTPHITQSFSAVEEQVTQRGHFRNPTVASPGYTADSSAATALAIARSKLRHPAVQGPPVGSCRKGSISAVPRIFTGLDELERGVFDLALHRVKTPEEQGSLPHVSSPLSTVMCVGDSPPQQSPAPSVPSSLVPHMQLREALVWKQRVVNGEVQRYRAPRSPGQLDRSQAPMDSESPEDSCSSGEP